MPTRPLSRCPGCRVLQATPGRCPTCRGEARREEDARRGTFRQRGYDTQHDREAKAAKAQAIELGQFCPRCLQPLLPGQALDYGHSTACAHDPSARADRVEHSRCNRAAGARHG
jgi:hypothetical protein